jgi:zinc/manganese transport system substrate-binding protein
MNRITNFNVCFLLLTLGAAPARAQLQIFTCEPEWAALATELGGDRVEAESAVTGLQDVHYIQARPSLIAKVRRADLMICTGADLEIGWLPLLLRQANNPAIQPSELGFMAATDFVDLLEQPQVVDRALGDIHPFGNPHIQTDPRNIGRVAAALSERLQMLDADQTEFYAARYADFSARWEDAVQRWSTRAESLRGQAIVTHHKSWVYMIDWLGLNEIATLEPKPGVPPSTSHLARMLEQLQNANVRLIVRSAYQNGRGSHWFSDRMGIPAVVLPHTVGSVDGADDLFGMFDVMIDVLLEPEE